jgi:phosphopantothenoylcysteine decarboxylase/phosphopantothenate--cysteine ligase
MKGAVLKALPEAGILIKAAAVSDYRPQRTEEGKIKKGGSELTLTLERTPDILGEIGSQAGGDGRPLLVGFAAETENLIENAKEKLVKKNLDLVVANSVGKAEGAMGTDVSTAVLVGKTGRPIETPRLTKQALAEVILDRVRELLSEGEGKVRRLGGGAH